MIKLSLTEVANLLNISIPSKDVIFAGISKDTRTLKKNNLYVAIRGEQFDGHDYAQAAIVQGAAAVLVDHKIDADIPQLVVKDTLLALGQICQYWRNKFSLPIVGVTGSNGKTTLKNMIASIMSVACDSDETAVLATEGNLNNNIGVPLMLSQLSPKHQFAVIEMGMNNFNEISYLTKLVKPKVAIVNNAAEAHLEKLKDVAGVARAKGEIFQGLTEDGIAILNHDDAHYDYWKNLVTQSLTFGLEPSADVTAALGKSTLFKTPQGEIEINLPLLGKHNIMNALAATAATLALGFDLATIKAGLESMNPAPGRMRQYRLPHGVCIIDDTYNANPFSLRAAVQTLASFDGIKIIVLGDMKELGSQARQLHLQAGTDMRDAGINYLFTFGDLSAATTEGFGNNALHFTDRNFLIQALQPYLNNQVTVLVKGSRSMKMETVLASIIPKNQLEHSH